MAKVDSDVGLIRVDCGDARRWVFCCDQWVGHGSLSPPPVLSNTHLPRFISAGRDGRGEPISSSPPVRRGGRFR